MNSTACAYWQGLCIKENKLRTALMIDDDLEQGHRQYKY